MTAAVVMFDVQLEVYSAYFVKHVSRQKWETNEFFYFETIVWLVFVSHETPVWQNGKK